MYKEVFKYGLGFRESIHIIQKLILGIDLVWFSV